jgi:hypothetical protein
MRVVLWGPSVGRESDAPPSAGPARRHARTADGGHGLATPRRWTVNNMTAIHNHFQDTQAPIAPAALGCGDATGADATPNPFKDMLAELDAICRQARELSAQLATQMADQKRAEQSVIAPIQFSRPA